jgi:hypothetical protein
MEEKPEHNPSPGVRKIETTMTAGEYILPLPEDKPQPKKEVSDE